jgi:hypothetical protein
VAVEEVTPLLTDVTAGVTILRLAGVDTVAVEGRDTDILEELSAVLALPDEIKAPWIVTEEL